MSQTYAERPRDKYIACSKAQAAINSVVRLSLREADADVLKHLCLCSSCRELVSEARKFAIRLLPENAESNQNLLCSHVSPNDVFDYVVPYGLDPSSDQYVKFRESLASHMRKCPTCLKKIQDLHETLFDIIERPESGVVTVCHTIESAAAKMPADRHSENLYSGFPIRVEVSGSQGVDAEKQPILPDTVTATTERRFSIRRLAPLAKLGGIAAAVTITMFFLWSVPSAKAVTLEQVYEAVLKVKNVYIASFAPDKTGPTQEKWVSRKLGVYVTRNSGELTLWNTYDGIRKIRASKIGKMEQTLLSYEDTAKIKTMISGSLGLMPFEDISAIPKDAQWHRLADASDAPNNVEVYDLLWVEKRYSGPSASNKWRMYIDPETKLPRRTEFYQMLPGEQEYVLKSSKVIDYPADDETKEMLENLSF